MNKEKVVKFYNLADQYCRYITENEVSAQSAPMIIELLMKLYISVSHLPNAEPETIDLSSDTSEPIVIKISKMISPFYWEIFDPYVKEEPVCGELRDDLSEIAEDLMEGMKEYDKGRIGNAVFAWKDGFKTHWGQHVVDALKALHAVKEQ